MNTRITSSCEVSLLLKLNNNNKNHTHRTICKEKAGPLALRPTPSVSIPEGKRLPRRLPPCLPRQRGNDERPGGVQLPHQDPVCPGRPAGAHRAPGAHRPVGAAADGDAAGSGAPAVPANCRWRPPHRGAGRVGRAGLCPQGVPGLRPPAPLQAAPRGQVQPGSQVGTPGWGAAAGQGGTSVCSVGVWVCGWVKRCAKGEGQSKVAPKDRCCWGWGFVSCPQHPLFCPSWGMQRAGQAAFQGICFRSFSFPEANQIW